MSSWQYLLASTRGVRRVMELVTGLRLEKYRRQELRRCAEYPKLLPNFEERVFSQHGEDGIIEEIFRRVGTTNRVFVEFGCGDGRENNTRRLAEMEGWSGFWLDGSRADIERARALGGPVKVEHCLLTRENIVPRFEGLGVPAGFDLLSIDVDGNDYWLWSELSAYRPRVVVAEYNAAFGASRLWVMPYKPDHVFDGTRHFGASLAALVELGQRQGYTLVGCESVGVNAFFVRNDLMGDDRFVEPTGGAAFHYVAPKHKACFFGHPSGSGPWLQTGVGWATSPYETEVRRRARYLSARRGST